MSVRTKPVETHWLCFEPCGWCLSRNEYGRDFVEWTMGIWSALSTTWGGTLACSAYHKWFARGSRDQTSQRSLCSQHKTKSSDEKCSGQTTGTILQLVSIKRATAILLRVKALLRKKASVHLSEPITVSEIQQAELAILNYIQMESFGSSRAKSSSLLKLKAFEDENNQLRVGGRLSNAPIPFEAKHPVILPNDHHVTQLIISHYHLRLGHAGPERVLADIRQRFWIIKGRIVINRALKSCLQCRKLRAKPQSQQMADLPGSRVTPGEPPFTRVGIDYFGPFLVKKARSELKRYGCLFTCLTTRAIHLEVAHTLDTDSFINALQRFIARRGPPTEIRSDNGTNFVGGLRELRKAISEWNQPKISDYLLQNNVKWIFNPPAASHMGGVWERQIRTVRSILNTVLLQQALDDEGLTTLFVVLSLLSMVDQSLNSQMTHQILYHSPQIIYCYSVQGPTLPPGAFVKQDLYRRRWRQVQYLADVFWCRWLKEYLPALQQRQNGYNQSGIFK